MVLVTRCKFGNQAAKAIIVTVINKVAAKYLGCQIIFAMVVISLFKQWINNCLESSKWLCSNQ